MLRRSGQVAPIKIVRICIGPWLYFHRIRTLLLKSVSTWLPPRPRVLEQGALLSKLVSIFVSMPCMYGRTRHGHAFVSWRTFVLINMWPTKWRSMEWMLRPCFRFVFATVWTCQGHARHTRTCLHHAVLGRWIWCEQLGVVNYLDIVYQVSLHFVLSIPCAVVPW